MIGAIVDTGDLLQVIWTSLAAGIGVTSIFGVAILGATRALDMGREGRVPEAAFFGVVGAIALAVVVGVIVLGIVLLVEK